MAELVLGPLLRYVDETTATIWVETDEPCRVSVLGSSAATFTVHGHHYALVDVANLSPASTAPYTVELDGRRVWPDPQSPHPPSHIRTLDPESPVCLALGSCRRDAPHDASGRRLVGVDMLRAYGQRLSAALRRDGPATPAAVLPASLLLIGDQVYADAVPETLRTIIAGRRDPEKPPGWEVADFEEYTHLYRLSWNEPTVRWLLSTVPSMMIFDDHEISDDWNISAAWWQRMQELPWWRERATAGIGAYWIYQHLGNLSPAQRESDPLWAALSQPDAETGFGPDHGETVDDLSWRAARDGDGQWHYGRDIGRTRVLFLDSRGGRVLDQPRRMLGTRQLDWFDQQVRGDVDHLLIATSIPYLLPEAVHHGEAANEALCHGSRGARLATISERIRQKYDLEHWAAFQYSFRAVADRVNELAAGSRGERPASIVFLSGDVHYSYLSTVTAAGTDDTPIHQVVSSPIRNSLPPKLRVACRVSTLSVAAAVFRGLARLAKAPRSPLSWRIDRGVWFDNALATLELEGRVARVRWEAPQVPAETASPTEPPPLKPLAIARLSTAAASAAQPARAVQDS